VSVYRLENFPLPSGEKLVMRRHGVFAQLVYVIALVLLFTANPRCHADALPIGDGSWTLVILPDTQVYSRAYPQHYEAQTRWIVDHAKTHNIKYVLHEGDITDNNVTQQWDNAVKAMKLLDGKVPYALVPGNHDYGPNGNAADRTTMFTEERYFGIGSANSKQPSLGGFFEADSTENSYHTFEAGGMKWLVIGLEWAPRDEAVAWANMIAADHPDHSIMLLTHAYMYYDDTRYDWATKGNDQTWNPHSYGVAKVSGETVNDGQQLWQKLVSKYPNFRFTFNGHVLGDGTGRLSSEGENGNTVHQILANYQFKEEGGRGDMRLLEFLNDGKTVEVRTYSPVLDRYDTAEDQQFTLKYE
jgi:hypothetical protein